MSYYRQSPQEITLSRKWKWKWSWCVLFLVQNFWSVWSIVKVVVGRWRNKAESSTIHIRSIRIFQIILFKMESTTLKNHFYFLKRSQLQKRSQKSYFAWLPDHFYLYWLSAAEKLVRQTKQRLFWTTALVDLKVFSILVQTLERIHCKIFMSQAQLLCETPWSCCSSQAPSPCGSPRCRRRSATSFQSQEEPRTWTMREYMFCLRIFFNSIREFSSVKTFFLFFPLLRALALIFSWQAQIDWQASWI